MTAKSFDYYKKLFFQGFLGISAYIFVFSVGGLASKIYPSFFLLGFLGLFIPFVVIRLTYSREFYDDWDCAIINAYSLLLSPLLVTYGFIGMAGEFVKHLIKGNVEVQV